MQILFGVLAILSGIVGTILFGVIGMAVTVVFAVLAIVFGVRNKKIKGGSAAPGITTAIIGIVISLIGTVIMFALADEMKKQATEQNLPIMAEYGDSLKFGIGGFAIKIANTEYDLEAVKAELEKLNKTSGTEATTQAQ